jgi:hypothetical protein
MFPKSVSATYGMRVDSIEVCRLITKAISLPKSNHREIIGSSFLKNWAQQKTRAWRVTLKFGRNTGTYFNLA